MGYTEKLANDTEKDDFKTCRPSIEWLCTEEYTESPSKGWQWGGLQPEREIEEDQQRPEPD